MLLIDNSDNNNEQTLSGQLPIAESLLTEPGELPRLELLLDLNDNFYQPTDKLFVADGWVKVPYDNEEINSLALVDLWIQDPNKNWSLNRITNQFQAWQENKSWGKFEFELDDLIGYEPGEYVLWGKAFYGRSDVEPSREQIARFTVDNTAPTELLFELEPSFGNSLYSPVDTIKLKEGWIKDFNGAGDVDRVDFWLKREDGTWQDLEDATEFTSWSEGEEWSSFDYELDLQSLDLAGDSKYTLWARAYDKSGEASNERMIGFNTVGFADASPDSLMGSSGMIYYLDDHEINYYKQNSNLDYAVIESFNEDDLIILPGSRDDYSLGSVTTDSASGTGIYKGDNDLIAIIEGVELSFDGSSFGFL